MHLESKQLSSENKGPPPIPPRSCRSESPPADYSQCANPRQPAPPFCPKNCRSARPAPHDRTAKASIARLENSFPTTLPGNIAAHFLNPTPRAPGKTKPQNPAHTSSNWPRPNPTADPK